MKNLVIKAVIVILIISAPLFSVEAATDMKFFKKAADRVWNTRNELFDPNVEIPDSIKEGVSAVVLADYNFIDADYDYYECATKRTYWNRRMVKVLDSKAVEDFTEFEFGQKERLNAEFFTFGGSDNAFGARIHKPDGQTIDVDLSQAVEIKEGKKNREKDVVSRKIAIPGLEPGDILEYFDYTEEWMRHYDLPALDFVPVDKYPVMAYMLEGEFAPKLTVEYRSYNGLPSPVRGKTDKGDNGIFLTLSYVDVVKDRLCLRRFRQIPFLRINTLNNNSEHRFYPMSKRGGGIYEHVSTGTIYRDIKYVLAASSYDLNLPGKIVSLAKNYMKAHPEASRHDLIDAAWMCAVYLNTTDKKNAVSDYWLALIFCDVLKKIGLSDGSDTGVGFINSRLDVPTEMIMNWRQPDFGAMVGDSIYLPNTLLRYLPGEIPAEYQGEKGGAFMGERKDLTTLTEPSIFSTPTSRAAQNKFISSARLRIDPENNTAEGKAEFSVVGAIKNMITGVIDFNDWTQAVEDYLGIPENKRYKEGKRDELERSKELNETATHLAKSFIGKSITNASDLNVSQLGVVPGAPELKFDMKFKAEGFLSDAGNDLLLNIGSFAGDNQRIEGDERQRQLDAIQGAPRQYAYSVTIEIPDGYEVDAASLEALKVNVNNKYGAYFASAKLEDNGDVTLNVLERYNAYIIPADKWDNYLQIIDAAWTFNDASILLKKK